MIRKKMLGVLLIGGLVGLTAQPSGAGAVTPGDRDLVLASSEKAAAEVRSPGARPVNRHWRHRHWRHRGGRHPFYGSGH
jgi:hypothetical protein